MATPSSLGRYQVRREIGRGGMGLVYQAFDASIERDVAIKVLHLDRAVGPTADELRQRFRREAQSAGRLSHPNIVGVYEYSDGDAMTEDGGGPYIVMELVAGKTLKAIFDTHTRFAIDDVVRLMGELLAALQHAHERGVIHRDIKPSNLIVVDGATPSTLKVADFGIARLDTSDLTLTGSTLGTATHMSPEQFLGQPVDRRTDLYASGVILFEFLTGKLPFAGPPSAIMHKVLNEQAPPPSTLNDGLAPVWDAIVRQAMAKRADDRFQSAGQFAEAIRAAAAGIDPDATLARTLPLATAAPRSRRTLFIGAALGCLIAGLAMTAYLVNPGKTRPARTFVEQAAAAPAAASAQPAGQGPSRESCQSNPDIDRLCPQVLGYHYRSEARDYAQAMKWFRVGADRGEARSQYEAGMMFLRGQGVARDDGAGFEWVRKAADQGYAIAENQLGVLFEHGEGVSKNLGTAAAWYRKSASHGNSYGQNNLGRMLIAGRGVARDPAQAIDLWVQAAAQNNPYAAYNLAYRYEKGEFVTASEKTAVYWYRAALRNGLETATLRDGRGDMKKVEHAKAYVAGRP